MRTSTSSGINYGQQQAMMILVAARMGLDPVLLDEPKAHLNGGVIRPTMGKAMEAEACRVHEQLRPDATLVATANAHAEKLMVEFGFEVEPVQLGV